MMLDISLGSRYFVVDNQNLLSTKRDEIEDWSVEGNQFKVFVKTDGEIKVYDEESLGDCMKLARKMISPRSPEIILAKEIGHSDNGKLVYKTLRSIHHEDESGQTRSLTVKINAEKIKSAKFNGIDHLVVPVVALVEGVIQCSGCPEPELVLSNEFANPVEMWNGRPVTLGHPEINGRKVSASSPDISEDWTIGTVFNSKLKGKKLMLEAWIDLKKVSKLGDEAEKLVERLKNHDQVEISTGYFASTRAEKGIYQGKKFSAVQEDIKPDHLAILDEGTEGACSWKDGCGAPRNSEKANCACKDVYAIFSHLYKDNRVTDQDKRVAIEIELQQNGEQAFGIVALFDDSVVFFDYMSGKLYEQSFDSDKEGNIQLSKDKIWVRPKTDFVRVKERDNAMNRTDMVNYLINTEGNDFSEDDRKWLEDADYMSDSQIEKIYNLAKEEGSKDDQDSDGSSEESETSIDDTEDQDNRRNSKKSKSLEEYLEEAPDEIRSVLTNSVQLHKNRVNRLIKTLVKNENCKFTKVELEGMDINTLENLVVLSNSKADEDVNYEGRGFRVRSNDDDDAVPPAPKVFDLKKKTA